MASPVLTRNKNFTAGNPTGGTPADYYGGYNTPGSVVGAEKISVNSVLQRTGVSFLVLLAAAVVGWQFPVLIIPGVIGGLVFGLINAFKREPSPALVLLYAGFEGAALGGISGIFEGRYDGIVLQAVLGTFAVAGVVFGLFSFAGLRATPKATKIFIAVTLGYLLFSLVNFVLVITGISTDPYGLRGSVTLFGIPLGILLGVLAVVLASYSLITDFTYVENAVDNGADKKYSWTAAFGIMVSLVWLYLEILRILGLARR